MDESFFHSLLRISIAQILKASGFDKCKPLTLNIITDIYIKHFELVLNSAKKFGQARTSCTDVLEAPDLVQALLDVQLIKPLTGEGALDPRDAPHEPETEYNVKSLESFVRWLQFSDQFNLAKKLSDVPSSQLRNLMEKRKIDTSSETDQEKKKRRLRERQEYYNQLKLGENPANSQYGGMADELEESEVTENDKLSWLAYLAEKDVKLGHNLQYANTALQDTILPIHRNSKYHPSKDGEDAYHLFLSHAHNSLKSDHVLLSIQGTEAENNPEQGSAQIVQPSQKLKDSLPYNLKYQESLLSDDLQQYIDYTEKYGLPVTPVSAHSADEMEVDAPVNDTATKEENDAVDEKLNDGDEGTHTNNSGGESQEGATEPTTILKANEDEEKKEAEAGDELKETADDRDEKKGAGDTEPPKEGEVESEKPEEPSSDNVENEAAEASGKATEDTAKEETEDIQPDIKSES